MEGELWARGQLEALRESGFTPAATVRFLAAARRRAADVRADRPELARQARSWIAVGALAWIALAAAGAEPFRGRLRAALASWAVTGLMLDWHLGMVETEDGRPRRSASPTPSRSRARGSSRSRPTGPPRSCAGRRS